MQKHVSSSGIRTAEVSDLAALGPDGVDGGARGVGERGQRGWGHGVEVALDDDDFELRAGRGCFGHGAKLRPGFAPGNRELPGLADGSTMWRWPSPRRSW
jgi:hypothetical protein